MIDIKENMPLAPYTTFEIGGSGAYFCAVTSEDELRETLAWAKEHAKPFFILGGGSNVLVRDEGFDGLVIHMNMKQHTIEGQSMTLEAGCVLKDSIDEAAKVGLGGWEKLAGIPGTVGGAARGNAGAFGTEIKDVTREVVALHTKTGERKAFTVSECDFGYRQSFFKSNPEWAIVSVTVDLEKVDADKSQALISETVAEREKRHLQHVRAAGSFFMNPIAPPRVVAQFETEKQTTARENRVPAGWLIEKVGLKGTRIGGAIASMQHPNYLVNDSGDAKAHEILELSTKIKSAVKAEFDIELHEEVSML